MCKNRVILERMIPVIQQKKDNQNRLYLCELRNIFIAESLNFLNSGDAICIAKNKLLFEDCVIDTISYDSESVNLNEQLLSFFSTNIEKIESFIQARIGVSII